jgi:glutathione synthase/RimK-type ligase-like ATP-grasp enzyme
VLGLIVVDNPADWQLEVPGVKLVAARAYLTDPAFSKLKGARVFNLCRSYRYQSLGYYVSLLAAARGHKPMPTMTTIQDMKSQTMIRFVSDDLDQLIQKSLASIHSDEFTLNIYFGRNLAKKYERLSIALFGLFQAPCMRAHFTHNGKWTLQNLGPIAASEIPEEHRPIVVQSANEYFAGKRLSSPRRKVPRYDLAILVNPAETTPPSDERALRRLERAAELLELGTERIEKSDYGRVAEFDALFIRETTSVNHHTYRFARRAAAEGLVVIDDPESILKCTNKVYLAELLDRYQIRTPRTMIVNRDNDDLIIAQLGLPCILKQPDSSFSQGVVKVDTPEELQREVARLLERSELIIAQEFLPTEFDWRIGVLDRRPIYACRYFMADKHWQIVKHGTNGQSQFGKSKTVAVELAPRQVVRTALKAANLIGDGLYGVDIKQTNGACYVIEVNDNPNIDAGVEDAVLKDDLYLDLMRVFLKRIERLKEGSWR